MNNLILSFPQKNLLLAPTTQSLINYDQSRTYPSTRTSKHWNPKWKKLRTAKVIKVDLPDYNEYLDDMTEEESRAKLKERGIQPNRYWMDRQVFISSTGGIFEPYVPPEGDGKFSFISKTVSRKNMFKHSSTLTT